ncbi:MAG: MBL fold metallo-hydrolase [Asgard group archaeon]|nr:MBL fold metallo-hydrolase [Asgard group archaeon]
MSIECKVEAITKKTAIGKTIINGRKNSNAGAIAVGDYVIAIDPSSSAESAPVFRKGLEDHFKLPIKYLHVTHYHGDHTKGIHAFQDTIVIGAKQLYDQMKKDGIPFPPEIMFTDKLIIENQGSQVEFHYIGGHTVCSSIAYFPEEKVIFLGDLLFADEFPWAGDASSNPDQWIAFFEDVLKLDFDHVVPGHGPLCDKVEIEKQLKLLKELRDNTLLALKENKGPTEITRSTIYKNASESRVTRTLHHFHNFYSKKTKS